MNSNMKKLFIVLLLISFAHLAYSVWCYHPRPSATTSGDFHQTYRAASQWKTTGRFEGINQHTGGVYYPPLAYALLLPFVGLNFLKVSFFFYGIQFPIFAAAIFLMAASVSKVGVPSWIEFLIAFILSVNFQPLLSTLAQHKVDGICFFLICLALWFFKLKRDFWVGVIIILGAALKYFPGILGVYFLLRREYGVVRGMLAGVAGLLLILLPLMGVQPMWTILIHHPIALLTDPSIEFNGLGVTTEWQTLGGAVYRLFGLPNPGISFEQNLAVGNFSIHHPRLAYQILTSLKILLIGCYGIWIVSRKKWAGGERHRRWEFYLLEFSISLLMLVVIPQGFRVHYGILLLPAFVIVALLLYQHRTFFGPVERGLFLLGYGLSSMFIPGGLLNQLPAHPIWGRQHSNMYLWLSLPFYGYVVLAVLIPLCYRKLSRCS